MNLVYNNLTIRSAMASDAEQLCAWWNDGKVMAHAGFPNGLGTTADEVRGSLAADTDETRRRHIIELDGKPIGEMNYQNKGNGTAEIGIKICDFTQQGKGLGTRLLSMFIDALFVYYGYDKIILDANAENKRARHVYEKLGFKMAGASQPFIDYELIEETWLSRTQEPLGYVHIRRERPDDYRAVEELTREAFWEGFWGDNQVICDEHLLVHRLRKSPAFVPELSLTAEATGKLVGHIIYSVSKVVDNSGKTHNMLTFGPLSVHPRHQDKGFGKALMRCSFKLAKELGYPAVIIFGHPDYYPKVGFRPAAEFGITTSDGKNFDPFMAYPLYGGALDGIQGRYCLDPVYESLTQEDALEFDKQFPAKKPYIPVSIDVLLKRLEPAAARAIQGLGFHALALLRTKSEREIRALEGIDARAIKTTHAVMREYSLR